MTTSGPPTEPSSSRDGSHEGIQAVVRALGSLLVALGATPAGPAAPPSGGAAGAAPSPELIFEDARRRAHASIDDAVERARAAAPTPDLAGVNARLDRLERRVDSIVSRLELPGGVAPTARAASAAPAAPAAEGSTAASDGSTAAAAPVAELNGDAAFEPGLGSLLIAVGPVSGFQGLMRVQSAIASVDAVEDVAIEGYARSEATVRALLSATLEPNRVAEALRRELGQPARVRETSAAERRLSIALGE